MTSRRVAAGAGALGLVVSLCVSGCAGLATSSKVHAEQAITNDAVPALNVQPQPPVPGESAREVLLGFLRVGSSLEDDYGVARQFLTAAASRRWNPSGAAAIITGESDIKVTALSARRATVSGVQQAERDSTGHVTSIVPMAKRSSDFGLTRVKGEWRISTLPANFQPWLTNADFLRVYSPQQVFYPAAVSKVLVPDVQWYPSTGLATALARAVLAVPPAWLRPALRPASASGVLLAINAVPLDSTTRVAAIDLTSSALTTDGVTRTALWAAMTATLTAVPGVSRVDLTVAGNRLAAPNLPSEPQGAADLGYSVAEPTAADEIVRDRTGLQWRHPNRALAGSVPGQPGKPRIRLPDITSKVYDVASDDTGTRVAALATDRRQVTLWINRAAHVLAPFAGNLTRPSFAGTTALLAGISGSPKGPRGGGGGVWAIDTQVPAARMRAQQLRTPWLGTSDVLSLKVSVGGSRVAMVIADADGRSTLRVASVLRDKRGVATGISTPRTLPTGLATVSDVAWLDDGTLAALGGGRTPIGAPPATPRVVQVPLSGQQSTFSAPPGVREVIAPGTGVADLFVVDQRGGVWIREGEGWTKLSGVIDVVAPGS